MSAPGRCHSCLAPDAAPYLDESGPLALCPTCARRYALWEAAQTQLTARVREVDRDWVNTWGSVPGIWTLGDALEHAGRELERELCGGQP